MASYARPQSRAASAIANFFKPKNSQRTKDEEESVGVEDEDDEEGDTLAERIANKLKKRKAAQKGSDAPANVNAEY